MAEVGIVQRLRGARRQVGDPGDQVTGHALAHERRRGLLDRAGLRGNRTEHDPSFADDAAVHPGSHRHAEHRKVERAPTPQLEVCGAPAVGRRELDVGDDFVGTLGEVFDAVVLIERGHRNRTLALRTHESKLCAEGPEHRRGVRRRHGPAPGAPRRHQTDVAVFLHAEPDGPTPFVGLIVIVASGVYTDVAPDSTHVPELRRGDKSCRHRERREVARDVAMGRDGRERCPGADREAGWRRAADAAQLAQTAQPDQHLGLELPALHVGIEIGAAGDEHRVAPVLGHEVRRARERRRRQVREGWQPDHEANGLDTTASAGWPKADSTASGALNVSSGSRSGPTRAGLPAHLRSSALRILSGVIGTSSMRIPSAWWIAFAIAGITGRSGPWPASLAPNGPSGSSVSTRIVWISGVASVVGLLYSSIDGCLWRFFLKTCSSIKASPMPM